MNSQAAKALAEIFRARLSGSLPPRKACEGSLMAAFRIGRGERAFIFRSPMPAPWGALLIGGREHSQTYLCLTPPGETAVGDLAKTVVLPAELWRVSQALRRLESGPPSNLDAVFQALEIEGVVNAESFTHLQPLDRTNLLAESSDLRKITFPGGDRAPRLLRMPHESHRYRLCPLETPESSLIGLRRFLARRAVLAPTAKGLTIRPPSKPQPGDTLGLALSQVPFLQHSDGARAMMGGKNWKQAVPLLEPQVPFVRTGWEARVAEESGRLVRAEAAGKVERSAPDKIVIREAKRSRDYALLPQRPTAAHVPVGHISLVKVGQDVRKGDILATWPGIHQGKLALGRNVLVAYLPFFGHNVDDGIVVSQSLVDAFRSRHVYEFRAWLEEGEIFAAGPIPSEGHRLTEDGIIKGDAEVRPGELLIRKRLRGRGHRDVRYEGHVAGRVVRSVVSGAEAIVWVEVERGLETGDKLTGRHGNKGVASHILPANEMPYFVLGGQRFEIGAILNPMGVVGRMNLGQLLETHSSWVADKNTSKESCVGAPFRQADVAGLRRALSDLGLPDGKAEIFLDRAGGKVSLGKAVVGFQYLAKLNHLSADKLHVRSAGGPYSAVTSQPAEGARLGGGQRLGEMEVWALLAHGASAVLAETLSAKSDDLLARRTLALSLAAESKGLLKLPFLGFPETLRSSIMYLRGVGFDLALGDGRGAPTQALASAKRATLRPANPMAVRGWSQGEVKSTSDLRSAKIFGKSEEEERERMGFIRLALPLPHPLRFGQGEDHLLEKGERGRKVTPKYFKRWGQWADEALESGHTLELLSVVPLALRPDSNGMQGPLDRLYEEVIWANQALARSIKNDKFVDESRFKLYKAVKRLLVRGRKQPRAYSLLDHLDGKWGLLRRGLLGKRQDYSGRAVIVPDPDLLIDECGLPFVMAAELFRPLLLRRLSNAGEGGATGLLGRALLGPGPERAAVTEALNELFEKGRGKSGFLVLLNRQPTLHRPSILAFRPKVRADTVIGLPPLVCAGFNADFDGDTMAVHLPLTGGAQEECEGLLPSRNLFGPSNGELALSLSQDILLGAWMLSRDVEGRRRLGGALGVILEGPLEKGDLQRHVERLVKGGKNLEVLSRKLHGLQAICLEAASTGKASFGYFDLLGAALPEVECKKLVKDIGVVRKRDLEKAAKFNTAVADAVRKRLKDDNPFALYFLSRAKGGDEHLRQIAGMVGYLLGGDGELLMPAITSSFVKGLTEDEYWLLSQSTRRTMLDKKLSVAEAGELTRDLVEGAYEVRAVEGDCKTKDRLELGKDMADLFRGRTQSNSGVLRSPLTCASKSGVCQACYGLEPGTGKSAKPGALIGILAAQSVGERGTQLAMRTFHTGGQTLPIEEVSDILVRGKVGGATTPQAVFDTAIPVLLKVYGRTVSPIHFEILLRAMTADGSSMGLRERGLEAARRGFLAALTYREARRFLGGVLKEGGVVSDPLTSPKSLVALGWPPRTEAYGS